MDTYYAKPWYGSRTIWFNVIEGLVAITTALLSPEVGLSKEFVSILIIVNTVGNVIWRLITTKPIEGVLK